jgi:hypothetical protein
MTTEAITPPSQRTIEDMIARKRSEVTFSPASGLLHF